MPLSDQTYKPGFFLLNDIYQSIQGEGSLTGTAMVVLRLHGCPVGCPFCDTKKTWVVDPAHKVDTIPEALGENERYCEATGTEIAAYIRRTYPGPKWIMLTGGEPSTQWLKPLVVALHDAGYKVALETSGTADGCLGAPIDWLAVSPKINMPGGRELLPEVLLFADEIKFVVGRERDLEVLDQMLDEYKLKPGCVIALQPMSKGQRATELCMETVIERGWKLSIQLHKYLDVR